MIMRVKLVIINNSAGIKPSNVRKSKVWTGNDQLCPPSGNVRLITGGNDARACIGSINNNEAIIAGDFTENMSASS
ncbi:hypothetical protein PROSTU_02048 [Providencia stuartii ATCC 25827]|uniref:Uncharacterized protein n=1 Tax=Providencia stuartii ATCC 25827 TaxID=471874 RepID=A0AA86YI68_PROST|nr:hypothetical protein PROSTU_02048 [Providencia stuartii ATCC 25827]